MKKLNLTLHCGGHKVESTEVMHVPTPPSTDTWFPIPHFSLIERLRGLVKDAGMNIVEEVHALARDGQRYFGLFQVDGVPNFGAADTMGTVIGLRNSHDKSFPAGICAGAAPFVCDNLAFNSEVKIARRHTRFIMRDLPNLLAGAFGKLQNAWGNQAQRIERYQSVSINDLTAHDLIVKAFRAGGISKTQLADVVDQWHSPEHEIWGEEKNLWGLHNAFTNVLRGNVIALPKRSDALHCLLDSVAGFKSQELELEDTEEVEAEVMA